ncbi:Interferon-induced very large GTPase 1-like [Oopsacas minuta]|uniref:Interferon-induced very large GTPase 1-like n=1 Tax=Oopsacas minuta TaxID=111878 RepID=A0AAV7JPF9_9METZ|nr:Interferon-induced very large GTPase 1-like [Oopsacas minuta]
MYLKDTVLQLMQNLFVNYPEHGTIYSNRGSLQLYILKDLAKKKDFKAYISYISSPFGYINSIIHNNILEYSQKETVVTNILININQCIHNLKTQCIDAANSVSQNIDSWDEWKQHFINLSSNLFAQMLEASIGTFDWRAWISEVLTLDLFNEIQENILISLIECKSLCPFCREPCQLSAGEHEHYCGTFHRPQGLSGWRYLQSRKIVVEECTTSIRCDMRFRYKEEFYNYSDYRTVNEYFNSWRILGDDSIDSKYWQWVLYTFQKEFVAYYEILENEKIDIAWSNLTEEEIINDIEKHYEILFLKISNCSRINTFIFTLLRRLDLYILVIYVNVFVLIVATSGEDFSNQQLRHRLLYK